MSENAEQKFDGGFRLTEMVKAQRGLSDREIEIFLATGQKPDLSQPPPEELERIENETPVMTEQDAYAWLSGVTLTASAFFDFDSSHGVSPLYDEVVRPKALRFDPSQPRGDDGKWSDTPGGHGANGLGQITRERLSRINEGSAVAKRTDKWGMMWRGSGDKSHTVNVSTRETPDGPVIKKTISVEDLGDLDGDWEIPQIPRQKMGLDESPSAPKPAAKPAAKVAPKPSVKPVPTPRVESTSDSSYKSISHSDALAMQSKTHAYAKWSEEAAQDVKFYTDGSYSYINGFLRGTHKATGAEAQALRGQINRITKLMRPSTQDVKLLRMTRAEEFGVSPENLPSLVGKIGTAKGFSSTSVDKKFGEYANNVVQLTIEAPKGTKMAYLGGVSVNDHEHEMLLPPGTRYEFVSVNEPTDARNQWNVTLRVVS